MPTTFTSADAVETIANECIKRWHPDLYGAQIRYVFRSKAVKNRGRHVLGKARKVTNLAAYLALGGMEEPEPDEPPSPFFVIEIAYDTWELLTHDQRLALVDHELCHCVIDEDTERRDNLGLRGHDLEEFAAVVQRHGLWKPDVKYFAQVLRERELQEESAQEKER